MRLPTCTRIARRARAAAHAVIGFSYPVVPMGAARIRAQVSAAHSEADINFAADMFIESGRELGVIS